MSRLGLIDDVLHTVLKDPHEELPNVIAITGDDCTNGNARSEVDEATERMYVPIEPLTLVVVTEKDNGFPQTQRHSRFGVFTPALLAAGRVDERLRALDHQALDQP